MRLLVTFFLLLSGAFVFGAPSPTAQTPVSQFRLPTFTKEGHRSMLLQGSEAIVGQAQIELVDLNLTLFTGDETNTVDTIILSPQATAKPESEIVQGLMAVRIISDDLEITGIGWTYEHSKKKVSIHSNTRIVFRAQLPDILK